MFRRVNGATNSRRGMTLVEVVVSLALMMLLSLITVGGMIMHARMARTNLTREQIAENSRRFLDAAHVAALDATILRVDTGPSGPGTVLTIGKPDPDTVGAVIYKQFAYIDRDGKPATIGDNVIVQRDVNTPAASTGAQLIEYCSPVGENPIFEKAANTARTLISINVRAGDRTSPSNNADNAFTGPGYQSFLISSAVSQLL